MNGRPAGVPSDKVMPARSQRGAVNYLCDAFYGVKAVDREDGSDPSVTFQVADNVRHLMIAAMRIGAQYLPDVPPEQEGWSKGEYKSMVKEMTAGLKEALHQNFPGPRAAQRRKAKG